MAACCFWLLSQITYFEPTWTVKWRSFNNSSAARRFLGVSPCRAVSRFSNVTTFELKATSLSFIDHFLNRLFVPPLVVHPFAERGPSPTCDFHTYHYAGG